MKSKAEYDSQSGPSYEQLHDLCNELLEKHGKPAEHKYVAHIHRSRKEKLGRFLMSVASGAKPSRDEDIIDGTLPRTRVDLPFVWHSEATYGESASLTYTEGLVGHFEPKLIYEHGSGISNPYPASDMGAIGSREYCRVSIPLSAEEYEPARFRTLYDFLSIQGQYLDDHPEAKFPFKNFPTEQAQWIEYQERQIMTDVHSGTYLQ